MTTLVVVSVPIAMLNYMTLFGALHIIRESDQFNSFDSDQQNSLIMLLLIIHKYGVFIVQLFWGLWLFPFGYLTFKSRYVPRMIGILLMIACWIYIAGSILYFLDPSMLKKLSLVFDPIVIAAEVSFILWILIKGVNLEYEKIII